MDFRKPDSIPNPPAPSHPYLEMRRDAVLNIGGWQIIRLAVGSHDRLSFKNLDSQKLFEIDVEVRPSILWRLDALVTTGVSCHACGSLGRMQKHPAYEMEDLGHLIGWPVATIASRKLFGIPADYALFNRHDRQIHRRPTLDEIIAYARTLDSVRKI